MAVTAAVCILFQFFWINLWIDFIDFLTNQFFKEFDIFVDDVLGVGSQVDFSYMECVFPIVV